MITAGLGGITLKNENQKKNQNIERKNGENKHIKNTRMNCKETPSLASTRLSRTLTREGALRLGAPTAKLEQPLPVRAQLVSECFKRVNYIQKTMFGLGYHITTTGD